MGPTGLPAACDCLRARGRSAWPRGGLQRRGAAELGPKQIRANAISPGPIRTRAASGIAHFDELLAMEAAAAPEHQLVDIEDVGALAAFLVSDGTRRITGTIIPVDGGQHVIA